MNAYNRFQQQRRQARLCREVAALRELIASGQANRYAERKLKRLESELRSILP